MRRRWRVEDLARRADVSVDTIRFYQKRRLLPPPEREGRVAWYGPEHLERLARIRELRARGPHARADRAHARRRARRHRRAARGRGRSGRRRRTRRVPRPSSSSPTGRVCRSRCSKPSPAKACSCRASTTASRATRRPTSRSCNRVCACSNRASRSPTCSRSPANTTTRRATSPRPRSRSSTSYVRTPLRESDLPDDEKAEQLVAGVPHAAARGDHARRAPLPPCAPRGRAGAPRIGRRRHRSLRAVNAEAGAPARSGAGRT